METTKTGQHKRLHGDTGHTSLGVGSSTVESVRRGTGSFAAQGVYFVA